MNAPPMQKLTIHDIAKAVGVSTGTVSRALNGRSGVNPYTRQRVLEVVARLGYVPDIGARQLARGAKTVIGVMPYSDNSFRNPYYTLLLNAIQGALTGSGYNVHILGNDESMSNRYAGIILPGVKLADDRLAWLRRARLPFVTISAGADQHDFSSVELDNHTGMLEIMQYLLRRGHTRIAHLSGEPIGQDAQQRIDAYKEALRIAKLHYHSVLDGRFTELGAYRAVTRALQDGADFTALACASDEMALGAIQALKDLGKRVPEDIAVTGFDDLPLESFQAAHLTTAHQPLGDIGRATTQLLLEQLEGNPPRLITIAPRLIVRRSA